MSFGNYCICTVIMQCVLACGTGTAAWWNKHVISYCVEQSDAHCSELITIETDVSGCVVVF